jgi:hypothetical protein
VAQASGRGDAAADAASGPTGAGTRVESVMRADPAGLQHCYRVVGGAHDGEEFRTLVELGETLGPCRVVGLVDVRPA